MIKKLSVFTVVFTLISFSIFSETITFSADSMTGTAGSKKASEQEAARDALSKQAKIK